MSNRPRRKSRMFRAAKWLPILFGLLFTMAECARAQTTGTPPPLSGDCTVSSHGLIACTSTNGANFAPSATVDATNAANLVSGTIPVARLGNVPNLVNPVPVPAGGGEYPMMDGTGTSVADVSGNANTLNFCAAPNAPTWYTYGLAFLDAGSITGSSLACLNSPFSSFNTVYFATVTPTLVQNTGTTYSGLPFQTSPTIFGRSGGSGSIIVESQIYQNAFQPTVYLGGNTTLSDGYGGDHVFGFTCGTGGGSLDHWVVDGQEPVTYSQQGSSCSAIPITGGVYQIGTLQNQVSNAFRGVITYMIVYPGQHTVAQMQTVERYIQARLAARPTLPAYPNRTTSRSPQFVALGDSLTATYPGTSPWPNGLSLNNTYQVSSYAIYANTAFDMCKMGDQSWAQSIVPGRTVLHLWAGTNDFSIQNKSASDVWTSLVACGVKAEGMGARTIVATMIDRGGSGNSFIAKKNALNTLVRGNWKSSGAFDALDDIAEVPTLGADGASANSAGGNSGCFYTDQIHLVGPGAGTCGSLVMNGAASALSGYGLVAQLVSNVVNTLDGSSQSAPDIVSANAFTESYANNFVVQTPTAAATHTLVDCQGQASPRTVVNGAASFAITVSSVNSQAVVGNATVGPQTTASFMPMLTSASAGGCTWLRTQ